MHADLTKHQSCCGGDLRATVLSLIHWSIVHALFRFRSASSPRRCAGGQLAVCSPPHTRKTGAVPDIQFITERLKLSNRKYTQMRKWRYTGRARRAARSGWAAGWRNKRKFPYIVSFVLIQRERRVDVVVQKRERVEVDPLLARVPGCCQAMMRWVRTTVHCSPYHHIRAVPASWVRSSGFLTMLIPITTLTQLEKLLQLIVVAMIASSRSHELERSHELGDLHILLVRVDRDLYCRPRCRPPMSECSAENK